jgi:hypothetical protein
MTGSPFCSADVHWSRRKECFIGMHMYSRLIRLGNLESMLTQWHLPAKSRFPIPPFGALTASAWNVH